MPRFPDSLRSSRPATRVLLGLALLACFAFVLHAGLHFDLSQHPECPACQIVGKSASADGNLPVTVASPDWVQAPHVAEPEAVRSLGESGRPFPRGPPA